MTIASLLTGARVLLPRLLLFPLSFWSADDAFLLIGSFFSLYGAPKSLHFLYSYRGSHLFTLVHGRCPLLRPRPFPFAAPFLSSDIDRSAALGKSRFFIPPFFFSLFSAKFRFLSPLGERDTPLPASPPCSFIDGCLST